MNEHIEEPLFCVVCQQQIGDNILVISNSETNQAVCEHCIEALKNVCDQVRAHINELGIEGAAELAHQEYLQDLNS